MTTTTAHYERATTTCGNCGVHQAMHYGDVDLCCGCNVKAGNAPADWHTVCVATVAGEVTPLNRCSKPPLPDLRGRTAACYCGRTEPSSRSLAFFQYRGEGMERPICSVGTCHFFESVHQPINPATGRPGVTDHQFVARVYEHDSYDCGCRGWD